MYEYYNTVMQVEENRRLRLERARHYELVKLARQARMDNRWSKLLVKLAGILIQTGIHLKKYAEKDLNHHFPAVTLQDL